MLKVKHLTKEMAGEELCIDTKDETQTWETLLSKIKGTGCTESQKGLFYSTFSHLFYRRLQEVIANPVFYAKGRTIMV